MPESTRVVRIRSSNGNVFPMPPGLHETMARPGPARGGCRADNFEVTDIPDSIDDAEVAKLLGMSADLTRFFGKQRYSFRFDELGHGRVLR